MQYRFGIQIISYNRPQYLKQTLESLMTVIDKSQDKIAVIEQSDSNNQIKCIEICQQFENISVYPIFTNLGQRGATNFLASSGFWNDCDYIMLSDHDNIFHDSVSVYSDYLKNNSDIWITSGLIR